MLIIDNPKREYGKILESKLYKRGRIHTHWAIQAAGDVLRSRGQSADINKKEMRLWNDVMKIIRFIHGNNLDVKEVKQKWNNLTGSAKACVDCSRREARMTGRGPNEAGEVEDGDILILSSDKEVSTSVTERVSQISSKPAFTGISESIDLFEPPKTLPTLTEISESCAVPQVFERSYYYRSPRSKPETQKGH